MPLQFAALPLLPSTLRQKVSGGKQSHCGFFPSFGNDGELRPAILKVEHRICRSALAKNILPCSFTMDASSRPFGGEKDSGIKMSIGYAIHNDCLLHAFR